MNAVPARGVQGGNAQRKPQCVADFLLWSFDVLRSDLPEGFRNFCNGLDGFAVQLQVDEEHLVVTFSEGNATVDKVATFEEGSDSASSVRVTTTSALVLGVIDAELTLHQAVENDELQVVASLDQLDLLAVGLDRYIHCGVRSAKFPNILQSFRAFQERNRNDESSTDSK